MDTPVDLDRLDLAGDDSDAGVAALVDQLAVAIDDVRRDLDDLDLDPYALGDVADLLDAARARLDTIVARAGALAGYLRDRTDAVR